MTTERFPKIYLYRRIVQAKLFMDTHFADNINLDMIADEAYFSRFHFIRLFKMVYGKTPHQYLSTVRIENAKLLLQTNLTIADVCFSVGFESVSSFSGLFKRVTSKTPSVYQQEQLLRQIEINKDPLNFIPGCFAEKKGWTKNSTIRESH